MSYLYYFGLIPDAAAAIMLMAGLALCDVPGEYVYPTTYIIMLISLVSIYANLGYGIVNYRQAINRIRESMIGKTYADVEIKANTKNRELSKKSLLIVNDSLLLCHIDNDGKRFFSIVKSCREAEDWEDLVKYGVNMYFDRYQNNLKVVKLGTLDLKELVAYRRSIDL